uniref:Putative ferric-chelate reductase 1-like protein n=1 Tax=Magallana gigas TaxID=29159 RepID=K1QC66_MAGGI
MLSVFLTLALICGCSCYPSGAPESACTTMTPSHGVPPQNTSSPYVIQFSSSNFSMDITISSKDGNTSFKGFLVEVFTDQPTPNQLKESEFKVPENAHPTCNGGATHSDAKEKHMIGLQWQPTTSFTGKVKFRATIVQAYTVIWKNVESEYLSVDYTAPSTSPTCPLTTCESVVMWRRSGNCVDFKIVARLDRPNNRWVAIGFSPTGRMPKTSVIMCLVDNGKISVEEGINKGYSFGPLSNKTLGLTNISASVVDRVLRCTFTRQINISGSVESIYSLTKKYFLLLGDGPIIGGTPGQHEKTPVKSESRVDFLVNENVGSDDPSKTLYKLHGSLMILSWMFLSSVAIIIARYYKSEWRGMMPCGVKVWFAIHRTMMSLVFIITTASFIIIFIQVGSLLQETEGDIYVRYHPALGITVMALCVANPIMAFFRCDPGHKYRHVFHYSHMFVGTAAQILSAITIYFGVNLEKSNTPEEASYIVIAYIITYVIIEVILECQKYYRRNEEVDVYHKKNPNPA